jgi:hypothetical protein
MALRKRRGRPPEIPHRIGLRVYVSRREGRAIAAAARQAGRSASAWVRAVAVAALPAGRRGSAA